MAIKISVPSIYALSENGKKAFDICTEDYDKMTLHAYISCIQLYYILAFPCC